MSRAGSVALVVPTSVGETDVVLSSGCAPAGYRFPREVIAVAVRWYLRYGLSYRDVDLLAPQIRLAARPACPYCLSGCAPSETRPNTLISRARIAGGQRGADQACRGGIACTDVLAVRTDRTEQVRVSNRYPGPEPQY